MSKKKNPENSGSVLDDLSRAVKTVASQPWMARICAYVPLSAFLDMLKVTEATKDKLLSAWRCHVSWGDADLTLVSSERLADCLDASCHSNLVTVDRVTRALRGQGGIHIDMES